MLFVTCHFFVKAIVFFVLFKAISFSIYFTFWISGMIYKHVTWWDLTDINYVVFKMQSFLAELRIPKMAVCDVKLVILSYF